jgi:hypothetical protein
MQKHNTSFVIGRASHKIIEISYALKCTGVHGFGLLFNLELVLAGSKAFH